MPRPIMTYHAERGRMNAIELREAVSPIVVEMAQMGDLDAFEELVRRYTPVLMGFFLGRLRSEADRDDLVQEVWISVYENLGRLRDPDRFGGWAFRIARRKLVDFHRRRNRRPILVVAVGERANPGEDAGPAGYAIDRETFEMVGQAIGRLRSRYRLVVALRLIEEMSCVEIAERLGMKESTVRMRLKRGLEKLRRDLARQGVFENLRR